jgi:hypothetical protein
MGRRFVIRVELTPAAKRALSSLSDRNGMTQVSIMSRMVQWFAAQPDSVQGAILGRYPPDFEEDIARLILRRMSGEVDVK